MDTDLRYFSSFPILGEPKPTLERLAVTVQWLLQAVSDNKRRMDGFESELHRLFHENAGAIDLSKYPILANAVSFQNNVVDTPPVAATPPIQTWFEPGAETARGAEYAWTTVNRKGKRNQNQQLTGQQHYADGQKQQQRNVGHHQQHRGGGHHQQQHGGNQQQIGGQQHRARGQNQRDNGRQQRGERQQHKGSGQNQLSNGQRQQQRNNDRLSHDNSQRRQSVQRTQKQTDSNLQKTSRGQKLRWHQLPPYVEGDDDYNEFRSEIEIIEERGIKRPSNLKCKVEWRNTDVLKTGIPFIAHAIAQDCGMYRGVARHFVNVNGPVQIPDGVDGAPGTVIPIPMLNNDFPRSTLLHTVCKIKSSERLQDSMGKMTKSYKAGYKGLAKWCADNNVRELAMTPMGCRTDCLPDKWMEQQVWNAFADQDIHIVICSLPKWWWSKRAKRSHRGDQGRAPPDNEQRVQDESKLTLDDFRRSTSLTLLRPNISDQPLENAELSPPGTTDEEDFA